MKQMKFGDCLTQQVSLNFKENPTGDLKVITRTHSKAYYSKPIQVLLCNLTLTVFIYLTSQSQVKLLLCVILSELLLLKSNGLF